MAIEELKERLHKLINNTNNEILLEDMLHDAELRLHSPQSHVLEGLTEDDYSELVTLSGEKPEKDTITFTELKSSLGRWFTK